MLSPVLPKLYTWTMHCLELVVLVTLMPGKYHINKTYFVSRVNHDCLENDDYDYNDDSPGDHDELSGDFDESC